MAESPRQIVSFGPFRLDPAQRSLRCGTQEVRVGGRGMDVLLTLARRPGELVGKQELLRAAWPDTFVQDANLKVTIANLRRTLRRHAASGEFIQTVVGRGYWLNAGDPVEAGEPPLAADLAGARVPDTREIIGRDVEIARLAALLASSRIVTVVGPGGVGKTALAAAAVRNGATAARDAVAFVDLSRVANEEFVAPTIAAALGVGSGGDSVQSLISILARRKVLLVLDTCEHVLNAVAHICEVLLTRTAHVSILATSRELLRVRSEAVLWLAPLAVPTDEPSGAAALDFAAPRLLVTRAAERGGFVPHESDGPALVRICRGVEGLPLALELVAPRVAARGASAALTELEQTLLQLRRTGRSGPRRHRTLLETLRWSYSLLSPPEAATLRLCSVFAGPFVIEAVAAVAADIALSPVEIADALAGLRAKSMVVVDHGDGGVRYRLLDSTRAFAADLLDRHDEAATALSAHARWVLAMLTRAAADQPAMPAHGWRAAYARLIHDVRNAVGWTLDRSADPMLGVRLVAAALPLWQELSLGEEIQGGCGLALSELRRLGEPDPALELRLVVGLASVTTYLATDPDRAGSLFRSAIALAQATDDPQAECRTLGAFATYELMRSRVAEVPAALSAMRAAALRTGHPAAIWEEEQLRTQYEIRSCAFDAGYARARRLFEAMRDEAGRAVPTFQIHQKMNVRIQLAALSWLTGRTRDALDIAALAAAEARDIEHGLTLVHCLAQGVVWTLFQCSEYEAAVPHITAMREAIYRHGIAAWIPVADGYDAAIAAYLGHRPDPARLRSAFYGVRAGVVQIRHDARYTVLADAMIANGQMDDAAEVIAHVFHTSAEPWGRSELLRLSARVERSRGQVSKAAALLHEAVGAARADGSAAWSARAAADLATWPDDAGATPASSCPDREPDGDSTIQRLPEQSERLRRPGVTGSAG